MTLARKPFGGSVVNLMPFCNTGTGKYAAGLWQSVCSSAVSTFRTGKRKRTTKRRVSLSILSFKHIIIVYRNIISVHSSCK